MNWTWKVVWFYVRRDELAPYFTLFNNGEWLRIAWGK